MNLVIQPTALATWHTLLLEAQKKAAIHLLEDLENYLVFLLMRFNTQPEFSTSIIGLEFLQGLNHPNTYQITGDKCLLFAGLFPDCAQKRRVSIQYFVHLGQTAYSLRADTHKLYRLLASEFIQMMDVLHAMRDLSPHHEPNLLQSFELWQTLGSPYAFKKICETRQGSLPLAALTQEKMKKH